MEEPLQVFGALANPSLPFIEDLESQFPLVGRFLDERGQAVVSGLSPDQVVNVLTDVFD